MFPDLIMCLILVICVVIMRKSENKLDLFTWVIYSILSVMFWQGMYVFLASLLKIPQTQITFLAWLAFGCVLCLARCFKKTEHTWGFKLQAYQVDLRSAYSCGIAMVFAMVAGLLFFKPGLIPSSMTGDPPRHFDAMLNAIGNGGSVYKPLYYKSTGIVYSVLEFVMLRDQAFVLSNILNFTLVSMATSTVYLKLSQKASYITATMVALFTCFGYAYFSLQYGYYTLLLSSAFFMAAIGLLLEAEHTLDLDFRYPWVVGMVLGIVLTHSYLVPEAALFFFVLTIYPLLHSKFHIERVLKVVLYWSLIILVTSVSNHFVGLSPTEVADRYTTIIKARGFVNDGLLENLFLFVPFGLMYFFLSKNPLEKKIKVGVVLCCSIAFTGVMFVLHMKGIAAPYYVNRNLLVIMPVMLILTMLALEQLLPRMKALTIAIYGIYLLVMLIPFLIFHNLPLAQSRTSLLDLRDYGGIIYTQNIQNMSYSPLQMTEIDRELLIDIGNHPEDYFGHRPVSMALLGSDHETRWFYEYTGIYPSLYERKDGFLLTENYMKNYAMWKDSNEHEYITIIKHLSYNIDRKIVEEISQMSIIIVEGDSFIIYKKRSS